MWTTIKFQAPGTNTHVLFQVVFMPKGIIRLLLQSATRQGEEDDDLQHFLQSHPTEEAIVDYCFKEQDTVEVILTLGENVGVKTIPCAEIDLNHILGVVRDLSNLALPEDEQITTLQRRDGRERKYK